MPSTVQGLGGTIFLLTDNSTQSGEWDSISLGAQAPNPASWMGYGLKYLTNNAANINVTPLDLSLYPLSYTQVLDPTNGICTALGSVSIWTSGQGTYIMQPSSVLGEGFVFTLLNIGSGTLSFTSLEPTDTFNSTVSNPNSFADGPGLLGQQQSVTITTDGAGNFYGYNAQAALSGVFGPLVGTTPGNLVKWDSSEGNLIADAGFSLPAPTALAPDDPAVPASILVTDETDYILQPMPLPTLMGGTGVAALNQNGAVVTNSDGTELDAAMGTTGQVLMATNGSQPSFQTLAPLVLEYDGDGSDLATPTLSVINAGTGGGINDQAALGCIGRDGPAALFENEGATSSTVTITQHSDSDTAAPALSIAVTNQSVPAVHCEGAIWIDDNGDYPGLYYSAQFAWYALKEGDAEKGTDTSPTPEEDNLPYSLSANNRIQAAEFNSYSSIKLKNKLLEGQEAEEEAVELFKKIPFVKYDFKDKVAEGDTVVYGMIAEELRKICPDYVSNSYKFVPNVFKFGDIVSKENIDKKLFEYTVAFFGEGINVDSIEGTRFKGRTETKTFEGTFLKIQKDSIRFSSIINIDVGTKCFIYGAYEKCPSISKQRVFEMNLMVTQSLLKKVEVLENVLKKNNLL